MESKINIRERKSIRPSIREADQVPEGVRQERNQCKDSVSRWVWKDLWDQKRMGHIFSRTGIHHHTLFCFFSSIFYESVSGYIFCLGLCGLAAVREICSGNLVQEVPTTNLPAGRSHSRLSPAGFHWGCHLSQRKSH